MRRVPNVFSSQTLTEFEDASASIPLRQLDRVFEGAAMRLGEDPGGLAGARRVQFRRYVASGDQHDPRHLDRLGEALGALIAEVAASKQQFLVRAAERDGFFFAGGVFRPAPTGPTSFAITRVEDLAAIDDRARRLYLLADENPQDAARGAKELLESLCWTVLRVAGEGAPGQRVDLAAITASALAVIEPVPAAAADANEGAALGRKCLEQICAVVAVIDELEAFYASGAGSDAKANVLSPRHTRLALAAAVTVAAFVADTYRERAASTHP